MFCPNCGTNQPDGTQFCSNCGAGLGTDQPQQPAAPVQPVQATTFVQPLTKGKFLSTAADAKTKSTAKISLFVTLACILVMVIGYIVAVNTSLEDIPFISSVLSMVDEDDVFDEAKDMMADAADQLNDEFEMNEDELEDLLSKSEMKKLEKFLDATEDCAKTLSINNLKNVAKQIKSLAKTDADSYLSLEDVGEDMEEVIMVLDVISVILLVGAIGSLLFTIIGGLCKITPLVSVGMVFSTIFCLTFYGFLFVVLNLAVHIALIVMLSKLTKAYKTYRTGMLSAQPAGW